MLPTLIDLRFDTPFAQGVLYLVAVLLFVCRPVRPPALQWRLS